MSGHIASIAICHGTPGPCVVRARELRASGVWRRGRSTMAAMTHERSARTVTLIGKPGCHLCDDARVVVEKVAAEVGAVVEEQDITQDEALYARYWEQIPVVLVDGEQHTFWRVDEKRLRAALTAK